MFFSKILSQTKLFEFIVFNRIPCSHHTYVVLGAYVVQSDAGDYDPNTHIGTEYIANIPFAPQQLQTTKMLQQIVELHKLHKWVGMFYVLKIVNYVEDDYLVIYVLYFSNIKEVWCRMYMWFRRKK